MAASPAPEKGLLDRFAASRRQKPSENHDQIKSLATLHALRPNCEHPKRCGWRIVISPATRGTVTWVPAGTKVDQTKFAVGTIAARKTVLVEEGAIGSPKLAALFVFIGLSADIPLAPRAQRQRRRRTGKEKVPGAWPVHCSPRTQFKIDVAA